MARAIIKDQNILRVLYSLGYTAKLKFQRAASYQLAPSGFVP
jgi:hypothetical protein